MPNDRILEEKKKIVSAMVEQMKTAQTGVLVDYKGISVAEDTKLRRDLRAAGVQYNVVKNTLTLLAVKETGLDDLESVLNGTTALATCDSDMVAPAKILCDYADKVNVKKDGPKFTIKAGFVEGRAISAQEVHALAKLPSKEQLVAQALAGFNAPITGFVNVLNGNLRGLVCALNAIAEKQGA